VFFRKHTQLKAVQLGITGWVKNTGKENRCFVDPAVESDAQTMNCGDCCTERNTVVGCGCGSHDAMDAFRHFLTVSASVSRNLREIMVVGLRDEVAFLAW
jgi:hypothetical protein